MESYFRVANKEETTTKEKMTAKETTQETTAKEDTTCKEDMAAKEDMDAKEDPASMEVAIMKKVEEVKEEEPSVSVPQIAQGSGTDSRPADARSVSVFIGRLEDPTVDFYVEGETITLTSDCDTNRRLPKNVVITMYRTGKLVRVNGDRMPEPCLLYGVTLTDLVIDSRNKTVMTFKELVKTTGATAIYGYKGFPEDKVPGIHEASCVMTLTIVGGNHFCMYMSKAS